MTKTKEDFSSLEEGIVRFYSCGPTVYDFAHVGNFRAFLTYDVIKRWLLYKGYRVEHVVNLTDVEDKIIRKVREQKIPLKELTDRFIHAFFNDLEMLNVIRAQYYPRATEHINEMVEMIEGLRRKGFAYEQDGSTYFSVSAFPKYGKLAELEKRTAGQDSPAESIEDADEYAKEDVRDFVLWKCRKETDGDVFWDSSLGRGRPGWHIECSCMAMKFLGPKLDIHGGGIDLVFPHHENEIAQSEASSGQAPFARFWLHNGFVNINGEKMSKSLGNFWTLRDIVKKPDDARAFRYFIVTSQYRTTLAMSEDCLRAAKSAIRRLDSLRVKLNETVQGNDTSGEADPAIIELVGKVRRDFASHMDDDLNTPRAAASLFELVNAAEKLLKKGGLSGPSAMLIDECLVDFDKVFGVFYSPKVNSVDEPTKASEVEIDPVLAQLLLERAEARRSKNWSRADEIRDDILKAGFVVKDTAAGPQLIPK